MSRGMQLSNVSLSHLRSKEITSIHKSYIPHSRATTKCKLVCIQMLPGKVVTHQTCTTLLSKTEVFDND